MKHLDALEIRDDDTRIRLATFQFRDSAETWWRSVKDTQDVSKLTWKEFSALFLDRFFPMVVQEQKRQEFSNLLQRTMSVTEYEIKFTSLSRFAKDMVTDEKWKCRKFEGGLIPDIAQMVVVHAYSNYRSLVDGALRAERQLAETKRIKAGRFGSAGGASGSHSQSHQTHASGQSQSHQQSPQQSHQPSRRGTRDDRSASGGARSFRAPQSSATVPSQGSGDRRSVTCFTCGRQGHMSRECRSARQPTQSTPSVQRPTCFRCGQSGHIARNCSLPRGQSQQSGPGSSYQTGASAAQSPQQQRAPALPATPSSGASTSRAGQFAPRAGGQQGTGTPQGRVFTVAATATPPDPSVVRGTFLVFSSWARVLVDTGASHSFIAASFSTALGLETDTLDPPLYVDTPIGGWVLLDSVCRGCDLTIAERTFVFDFIVLDMTAFDVILGMDWLSSVRAVIDCYQRRVTICTGDGDCFRFFLDRLDIVDSIISRRRDRDSIVCLLAGLSLSDGMMVPVVVIRGQHIWLGASGCLTPSHFVP